MGNYVMFAEFLWDAGDHDEQRQQREHFVGVDMDKTNMRA